MADMIRDTLNRIASLVKRCYITLVGGDNENFQTTQVKYLGKTANIEVIYPYGLCANPPVNSIGLMFNIQGQEENRAAIFNLPNQRFNNLNEGEVVVGNYLTGSYVKFLQNGNIEILSSGGSVTISGDVIVDGDVVASGISLISHVHGGVVVGGATTGIPQ